MVGGAASGGAGARCSGQVLASRNEALVHGTAPAAPCMHGLDGPVYGKLGPASPLLQPAAGPADAKGAAGPGTCASRGNNQAACGAAGLCLCTGAAGGKCTLLLPQGWAEWRGANSGRGSPAPADGRRASSSACWDARNSDSNPELSSAGAEALRATGASSGHDEGRAGGEGHAGGASSAGSASAALSCVTPQGGR